MATNSASWLYYGSLVLGRESQHCSLNTITCIYTVLKSPIYRGYQLCNGLPEEIQKIKSLPLFKNRIKDIFYRGYLNIGGTVLVRILPENARSNILFFYYLVYIKMSNGKGYYLNHLLSARYDCLSSLLL